MKNNSIIKIKRDETQRCATGLLPYSKLSVIAIDPGSNRFAIASANITLRNGTHLDNCAGINSVALNVSPTIGHPRLYSTILASTFTIYDLEVMTLAEKCKAISRIIRRWAFFDSNSNPLTAIIELPSGRVNTARHKGRGSGLATYGVAAGAALTALQSVLRPSRIIAWSEAWSGSSSKEKRKKVASTICRSYDPKADTGGDAADALCMIYFAALKREATEIKEPSRESEQ